MQKQKIKKEIPKWIKNIFSTSALSAPELRVMMSIFLVLLLIAGAIVLYLIRGSGQGAEGLRLVGAPTYFSVLGFNGAVGMICLGIIINCIVGFCRKK